MKARVRLCQGQRLARLRVQRIEGLRASRVQEAEGLRIFLSPSGAILLKLVTFHQSLWIQKFSLNGQGLTYDRGLMGPMVIMGWSMLDDCREWSLARIKGQLGQRSLMIVLSCSRSS